MMLLNEAVANQPSCCFGKRAKTKLERRQKLDQETLPKYLPLGQFFASGTTYFWPTSPCGHSYKEVSITNVNPNFNHNKQWNL